MELLIKQTKTRTYPERTKSNAKSAGLTMALAVDFSSRGEQLTADAAGPNYLAIHVNDNPLEAARNLYRELKKRGATTLNVAGNSIATFKDFDWTQEMVNERVFAIISKVHEFLPLERVFCGGQTGTDIAGGIAGVALAIPTEMTFPAGFLQRYDHKSDIEHTEDEIRSQVLAGVAALQKNGFTDIPAPAKAKRSRPSM